MKNPTFGTVISFRTFTTVRAMLVGPAASVTTRGERNWGAIVLRDDEEPPSDRWEIGEIITTAPDGDHVIEIAEGSE